MNYRHHFHAGNFADVMKHALLISLVRSLQKKEKGFLYLDTHAGRGRYDLEAAAAGDSLARKPEWPNGIGRLTDANRIQMPAAVAEYLSLVRAFDRRSGNVTDTTRFYPGSPWIAQLVARPVDRLMLFEKHPAECAALRGEFDGFARVSVQEMDGYMAVRAALPPPERRALVLIDPPFEAQNEFAQIAQAVKEALTRLAGAVLAIWYPLTGRARIDEFRAEILRLNLPPTLACELTIAAESAALKMNGCGLLVINPPWQFESEAKAVLSFLSHALAQSPGGGLRTDWVVPERSSL